MFCNLSRLRCFVNPLSVVLRLMSCHLFSDLPLCIFVQKLPTPLYDLQIGVRAREIQYIINLVSKDICK